MQFTGGLGRCTDFTSRMPLDRSKLQRGVFNSPSSKAALRLGRTQTRPKVVGYMDPKPYIPLYISLYTPFKGRDVFGVNCKMLLKLKDTFNGLLGPDPEWLSAFLRRLQVEHFAWSAKDEEGTEPT